METTMQEPHYKKGEDHDNEKLIQRFKRYYEDYRKTSDPDVSFSSSYEALTLSVIEQIELCANRRELEKIQNIIREYKEIRQSIQGSNDSVKERFEQQFMEQRHQ